VDESFYDVLVEHFDRGEDWLQAPEFIRGKNLFFP
jgi:hypothetical protein